MILQTLKTKLTTAISGIFTQIFFDYMSVLNTDVLKTYPYVAWNLDTMSGLVSFRETLKELDLEVIGVDVIDPETEDFIDKYDSIEALVLSYITAVAAQTGIQVLTLMAPVEYYPRGTVSNDSEIGVKVKVKIRIVC